uniref:Reverse transcriptase Ty1/copia-type domain-containing protein n=1 Tax=Lactuca sativa TaxID=4236 RepID=A0A9R1VPF4_LACSA|nr:hypothetical protein LSAT_V11C400164460 [Lactuca sativa]
MQEELVEFERNNGWDLVPTLEGVLVVGSRWVYRNKSDEDGVVIRNKAILVVKGYSQQEGIYYDETFVPAKRIESIRIFLAFATHKNFKVAYGLKQAPRAWYGTLSKCLEDSKFQRGFIDPTIFRKIHNNHLIIMLIYVNDIIFGSTSKDLSDEFVELMKSKFRMSMMGELNYFVGLQVCQSPKGIFIGQEKYIKNLLKRYSMENASTAKTPMSTSYKLDSNLDRKSVDQKHYRGTIGSLLYLTTSRPYIMFSTCPLERFQDNPKESHLMEAKRIFKYLKGTASLGLFYPTKGNFYLPAFTDSDYGGCKLDRKSTSGSCQFNFYC